MNYHAHIRMRPHMPLLIISHIVLLTLPAAATYWPIPPINQVHPLGNNWGNYQNYGSSPYFHPGIDIITTDTSGVEVRAVAHGWVKAWGTIQAELHYRLAVCDSPLTYSGRAEGWLYAHIDPNRWHKNLGDEVQEGEVIGYLVAWPIDASFDHLHFARISDTGATWQRFPQPTWWFIQNPLTIIQPNTDLEPPVFENARTNALFAFCRNNTSTYLNPNNLTGDVDIIAKIYDRTGFSTGNSTWDKLAPFLIEYSIKSVGGSIVVPWTIGVIFSGRLEDALVSVVYKNDNTCRSQGDYENRSYYYIVTNTDGDSIIESTDIQGKWATAEVGDGDYWVLIRASDVVGNTTVDSMLVHTANGVALAEQNSTFLTAPLRATPANGNWQIDFGISRAAPVRLTVFDPTGRQVTILAEQQLAPGNHRVSFRPSASGVYFVNMTVGFNQTYQTKLTVIK